MSKDPSNAMTEALDIRQTVEQTNIANSLSSKYNFSINSDQTLKNTMIAKDLLRRGQ